jgi:tRNA pseudouridine55 synthase
VTPPGGVLLADKPRGISSHAVVARARRALGERRIGHAGTLDPFATGLLILLIGRATRLQQLFMMLPKTYEVIARIGATSTTGDTEGEIVETGVRPVEPIVLPHGRIRQRPPAYSAVKVGGQRAYARARRGESFELPEREVEVYSAEQLWRDEDRVALRITCSAGTYIRSLVAEIGDAYCLELRRTAIGPFGVEGAWPTEGPVAPLDLRAACEQLIDAVELDADTAAKITHGRPVDLVLDAPVALLVGPAGEALALARQQDGGGPVKLTRL